MVLSALWRHRTDTPRRRLDNLAFLDREPLNAYHAQEADHITARQLNDFRKDPFIFRKRQTGLLREEEAYGQNTDRAALVLALEGQEEFERQFVSKGPFDPDTGKAYSEYSREYRDWAAAQDRVVLTEEQASKVEHIAFGINTHPESRKLLVDGVAQGVARCEYGGLLCQGRPDWLSRPQGLVGLIVCDSFVWLETTMRVGGLVHRLAFEHSLISQVTEVDVPVHIIAAEKYAPHRCGVWFVCERLLRKARKENDRAIAQLKQARTSDCWPTGYEKLRVLTPDTF